MSVQGFVVSVCGWVVTFLVPTVVWIMLVAGLLQLIREGIHRLRVVLPSSWTVVRRSTR